MARNGLIIKAFFRKIAASQNRISLLQFVIFCGIFCEIGNIGLGVILFLTYCKSIQTWAMEIHVLFSYQNDTMGFCRQSKKNCLILNLFDIKND